MKDNMKMWNTVSETNPSDTKQVNFGRNFTAIDAYSQIRRATEVFGPVGQGWGWKAVKWDYSIPGVVTVDFVFWYGSSDCPISFPVTGGCDITGKPKKDNDAKKKALTDGITKALSYLGFNADVFLGRFDDNKYVEEQRNKFANEANDGLREIADVVKGLLEKDDLLAAGQVWDETTDDEKKALWVAKSKNGFFTQDEKKAIRMAITAYHEANEEQA
jgi:hypothetical protein